MLIIEPTNADQVAETQRMCKNYIRAGAGHKYTSIVNIIYKYSVKLVQRFCLVLQVLTRNENV